MLQNAANQRSLAFLDQKIAIMYNYKVLLIKYIRNEKSEQIEKNIYSIIMLNSFLSFVIKSYFNNNKYIFKLYFAYHNMSPNCLIYI